MRNFHIWLCVAIALGACGCSKNPKDRLVGKWGGQSVTIADDAKAEASQQSDANAWAKGVRLDFKKDKMTVAIPSERARSGSYEVKSTSGDTVTVGVMREAGGYDVAMFRFRGSKMYWSVGDGHEVVMTRED